MNRKMLVVDFQMDRYVMQSHYLIEFCPFFLIMIWYLTTPHGSLRGTSALFHQYWGSWNIYRGFTIVSQCIYNWYVICFICCIRAVYDIYYNSCNFKKCSGCLCLKHSKSRFRATTIVVKFRDLDLRQGWYISTRFVFSTLIFVSNKIWRSMFFFSIFFDCLWIEKAHGFRPQSDIFSAIYLVT